MASTLALLLLAPSAAAVGANGTVAAAMDEGGDVPPLTHHHDCCSGARCTHCCTYLHSKHIIKFHDDICLDVLFDTGAQSLDVNVTLNGKEIYGHDFSLGHIEKQCWKAPVISKIAELCLDFNRVNLTVHRLSACAELELVAFGHDVGHADLGCLHFSL